MTAATAGEMERPPLTHTVKLEEGEHTVKMSYGLFQDLQRLIPDTAAIVDTVIADPFTRDYIQRRCMTDTKKMVKDMEAELVDPETLGLSDPDEINALLQWAVGHLLYFFATSAGGLKQLSAQLAQKLTLGQPAPSMSGSEA